MNSPSEHLGNLQKIWDTGATMPYDLPEGSEMLSYKEEFKARTGSQNVIALRWVCDGVEHEWRTPATPLPDRSGLVVPSSPHPYKKIVVINADGTQRCEITVPRIDRRSRPEDGYLELPPSQNVLEGIEWGAMCHDGYLRYLLEFDWRTGQLLRHAATPTPWM